MIDTQKLRQRILNLAIRGKLIPQDPNDEPASVLLDRIRTEKERLIAEGKIKRPKASKKTTDTPHYQNMPFEIPASWKWVRLEDIAKIGTGSTPAKSNKNYYGGTINWVSSAVTSNLFVDVPTDYITELALKETNCEVYPVGSLLMAMYGEGKTRGQITELRIEAASNQACAAIIPFSAETKDFIKIFLLANYFNLRRLAEGGNQPNLNLGKISSLMLPLPPFQEQRRIIQIYNIVLDHLSQLEKGIESTKEHIRLTKEKILQLAVTGKLVPQNPNDEPAAELLKRINPNAEIITDNGHYPQLPANWLYVRLGDVVKVINGKSRKEVENPNGEYPIYGSGGVIGFADSFSCLGGSTIIGRKGTINNPIFVETDFWNVDTAFGMKAKDGILDRYFFFFCQSFDFTSLDKSSTLPSLTKSAIENIPFPLPPLEVQSRIVSEIDKFNHLFNLIQEAI